MACSYFGKMELGHMLTILQFCRNGFFCLWIFKQSLEDPGSIPGSGRSAGEEIGYPLQYSSASLVAQLVKNCACNAEDLSLVPGLGRFLGERLGTPVFWPGEFHGLHSPWGHKESDMTEQLSLSLWTSNKNKSVSQVETQNGTTTLEDTLLVFYKTKYILILLP